MNADVRSHTPTPKYLYLLLAICLFAFAVRVWDIGGLRMWGDEGFSVYSANRDLYAITFEGKDVDPHPPLYYYLLHFYLPIGGFSEFSIRFYSVLFGTATVALVYAVGKQMFGRRVGLIAAAIMSISPFAVHYAQEVRMYAQVMFFGALAMWFFVRITHHASQSTAWVGFFFSMLLAQYSLYQTAFVFVAQGIFLAPFLKNRFGFVLRWLAVSITIVVLFVPWLLAHSGSALTDIQGVAGDTTPMSIFEFVARGLAAISVGTTLPLQNAFTLTALFIAVIIIGLLVALVQRRVQINDWMLIALVALPIVSYYPIYYVAPLYRGRLFALALVPLVVLLARSALVIIERARVTAILTAVLIVGASAYSLYDYYFRYDRYSASVEDYLPAIQFIEKHAQAGDEVLFHAYWQQGYFLSHYHGAPLVYASVDKPSDLSNAVSQPRNVWAIVQALSHHGVEDWLAQNAFPFGEQDFGRMRVLSYRTGTPTMGETFASPIQFDSGMQLLGYHVNGDAPIESGRGVVTLQLDWQAAQKIPIDYLISVRVTNDDGSIIWAQDDVPPANGAEPTSTWQPGQTIIDHRALMIPPGTPPGAYRVRVVVYESSSGRTVNIVAPEDRRGQAVATGAITIAANSLPVTIKPAVPLFAIWDNLALIGMDAMPEEINAGDTLPLTLYWKTLKKSTINYRVNAVLIDSAGTQDAFNAHRPASASYRSSAWNIGETWIDKFNLTVSASSPRGEASLFVYLSDDDSSATEPLPQVRVATVKINARVHKFALPLPKINTQATLDGKIKLLGYDLDSIQAGAPISLTLYWQATEPMSERYAVFVHALDATGNLIAQRDAEPVAGSAPTTSWLRGEVVADAYRIDLPRDLAPGDYRLIVGMYQAAQGKRLSVIETNQDSVPLANFKIAP